MSWFDRFFHFSRTNDIDQPAAYPKPSRDDLPKRPVALVGSYSDIDDPMYIQAISFVLESNGLLSAESSVTSKSGTTEPLASSKPWSQMELCRH